MASGDTLELKIISDNVGNKTLSVKKEESVTHDLGGFTSEILMNGNGTGHKKLTVKSWMIEGMQVDTDEDGTFEFLQAIQNNTGLDTFVWSSTTGAIYKGVGSITGDLKNDTTEGYATITVSGVGQLEKIS